jgi:hypothetical protein
MIFRLRCSRRYRRVSRTRSRVSIECYTMSHPNLRARSSCFEQTKCVGGSEYRALEDEDGNRLCVMIEIDLMDALMVVGGVCEYSDWASEYSSSLKTAGGGRRYFAMGRNSLFIMCSTCGQRITKPTKMSQYNHRCAKGRQSTCQIVFDVALCQLAKGRCPLCALYYCRPKATNHANLDRLLRQLPLEAFL